LILAFIPLILVFALLFAVIWIIFPPPNRHFWLLSIGVGEWSLWFGALAFLCIVAAVSIRVLIGEGWSWILTSALGITTILISLYPLFSVFSLSRKHDIPLSLRRYFNNLPAKDFFLGYAPKGFTTRAFATIERSDLNLDIYLPTAATENNGASVIVVHGGSWNGGARNDFPRWNEWLAGQGFTVFDIDYRLAPQPNYLAATVDVKTAVRWVKAHAAEFDIDPGRTALLGRTAGAQLALLAAYTPNDESEKVRAAVSFYGPLDLLWAYDIRGNKRVHDGPGALVNFLGGRPGESDELRQRYVDMSPVSHVNENTPPTFMIHGGRDRLVWWKNMYRLSEKLEAANVPHEIHLIPHGQHGFDYNINGWGSQATASLMMRFLAKNLSPR
jgi:acetyl esterase/lipase